MFPDIKRFRPEKRRPYVDTWGHGKNSKKQSEGAPAHAHGWNRGLGHCRASMQRKPEIPVRYSGKRAKPKVWFEPYSELHAAICSTTCVDTQVKSQKSVEQIKAGNQCYYCCHRPWSSALRSTRAATTRLYLEFERLMALGLLRPLWPRSLVADEGPRVCGSGSSVTIGISGKECIVDSPLPVCCHYTSGTQWESIFKGWRIEKV